MFEVVTKVELDEEFMTKEVLEKGFWEAIRVYIERPNILNKRIFGGHIIDVKYVLENSADGIILFIKHLNSIQRNDTSTLLELMQNQNHISIGETIQTDSWFVECKPIIILRKLLPKMKPPFNEEFELIIIDKTSNFCIFYPLSRSDLRNRLTPDLCYKFTFSADAYTNLTLEASSLKSETLIDNEKPSVEWLKTNVFPKIVKWSKDDENVTTTPPLHLIKIEHYNNLRLSLREKYAEYFIKIWPDDGTDPLKFVHEDIAIAAYLICLWEQERAKLNLGEKQSFVDLGCGNGLLVYILSSEGYPGIGVDLRKRQLWDILGSGINLKEMTIVPSSHSLFPNYDWLIGNHSDELTPWIPIIAARSSYNMKVFLLPCCPFTFDGKFERKQGGISQYQSYLTFVEKLCSEVGFNVQKDKLRIPSTKRTCFVCHSRNYSQDSEAIVDEKRMKFIKENSKTIRKTSDTNQNWSEGFVPRVKAPPVANCTQLDKNFLENVVNSIANLLLSRGEGFHEIETVSGLKKLKFGGTISLADLADSLDAEIKLKLKQQNGGLQTLIRNHRHIFEIKNGEILITKPLIIKSNETAKHSSKNNNKKKKLSSIQSRTCWFKKNHPEGCPLSNNECRYSHK